MKTWKLLIPMSATLFVACEGEESAAVDQDRIYTKFELLYDKNTDKTQARAEFRFGGLLGTLLALSAPAVVTFNNDELLLKQGFGYYEKEYAGRITTGTFSYKDINGVTYSNTTPTIASIEFDPNFTSVTRNQANTFTWTGSPIATNEALYLFITNKNNANVQTFSSNTLGATDMVLSAAKLNNLAPGIGAVADLYRDRIDSLSQKTAVGGYIKVNYRALKKDIAVN